MNNYFAKELEKSIRKKKHYRRKSPGADVTYFNIYLIGAYALGKKGTEEKSKNEFSWGKYLADNEIQVPEMFELIPSTSLDGFKEFSAKWYRFAENWYIIMERIRGKTLRDCRGLEKEGGIEQYIKELEKVLELGIYPADATFLGNAIFGDDDKIYLIDFEHWEEGSEKKLNSFYKTLKKLQNMSP